MKNIKSYEQLNEAKSSNKIDFQLFIDYMVMGLSDFKNMYKDMAEDMDVDFKKTLSELKELKSKCKIENSFDPNEMPFSYKLKTKYLFVYLFGQNIGDPTMYVISSSLDNLLKIVGEPDTM